MGYVSDIRKFVGQRPIMVPCACLVIGDGRGNVLLQKRADDGDWANHGGAMEPGETPEEAMRREIMEELGVTPVEPRLLGVYSGPEFRHTYPNGDVSDIVDIVYYCEEFRGELRLQAEEVEDVRWFPLKDLPERLMEHNRRPLRDYLKLIES